jgi:FAD/FMN-containing dehydrogenase
MDVAAAHLGRPAPVERADAYVLLECADHADPLTDLVAVLADAPGVVDSAVASDPPTVARLGEFRDRMTESISALGVPYKLDVAVGPSQLVELVAIARRATLQRGCRLLPFGHLAEGNVHLNVLGAPLGDGRHASVDAKTADALADDILGAVARLGGTISAEHGVGIAKSRWLPLVRTTAELAAAAAVRSALDPRHVLNPGVLELPG